MQKSSKDIGKIAILLYLLLYQYNSFSQTSKKVSASCGKCGKSVSINSKVGDRCPYCRVIWGSENSRTTNTILNYTPKISTNGESAQNQTISTGESPVSKKQTINVSKKDTEKWLLEKFNKYTVRKYGDNTLKQLIAPVRPVDYTSWFDNNFNFSFDEYNLNIQFRREKKRITYTEVKHSYGSSYESKEQRLPDEVIKVIIPISEITVFNTHYRSVSIFCDRNVINEISDGKDGFTTIFMWEMDMNQEADLENRIDAAFEHLRTLSKKAPKSKEAF